MDAPTEKLPLGEGQSAPCVLVVDDNPATRYATSRVIQAAGFEVRQAATGGEGLALADASVSAVILDVHLPDIDGFEVCRTLRTRPETARLPVIYLSAAYVRNDDKVRGLHSGADAYMTHPAEPALLVATVQALVRARTAEEAMRRSESRFRAIYDQAPSGICLLDSQGRFLEVNRAMLGLLKRETADVVGRRVADLAPPAWRDLIAQYLDRSLQGVWRGEFPLLTRTGEELHLEWSLSAHGEPGVSLAMATDVSERVALLRQREALLEREQAARVAAERVSRTKDEFIAVLSHELRTPLNAILSWVHVLKQPGAAANLPRGLEAIERNAKTQTRLISDILDVSRMDLGKLRLELEPVNPAEVVAAAVSAMAGSAQDKKLQVNVDIASVTRPILADAARLQQIVWNLLTNAIKFSMPGGVIGVRLDQDSTALRLTVQDQGQGIKPDFLPYLFDRFSQSDSASNRHHGGLGLGLSIVKHLVELHGGTIRAFSEGQGKGATFVVSLPWRAGVAGGGNEGSSSMVGTDGEDFRESTQAGELGDLGDLTGLDILVVEDDAEAREMLSMILRDRGAAVRTAGHAGQCLHQLAEAPPDVLISDIGLPGTDGYALIREIRRQEAGHGSRRLPAIALTAFARAQDRDLALAAGFDLHCAKPLRPNQLIAAILALLRRTPT